MLLIDCICMKPPPWTDDSSLFDAFAEVRAACRAMRHIFLPDDIWPRFRNWHLSENEAVHNSILLLAMERGYLGSITSFAHRYLIASKHQVRKQYLNDLREQWMNYDTP